MVKRCCRRRLLPYVRGRQPIAPETRDETRLAHTLARVPRHCTPCSPAHSTLFDAYYLIRRSGLRRHVLPSCTSVQRYAAGLPRAWPPHVQLDHLNTNLTGLCRYSLNTGLMISCAASSIIASIFDVKHYLHLQVRPFSFYAAGFRTHLVFCVHQIGRPNVDQLVPHISRHHQVCRSRISAHIVPWAKGIFARSERLMRTWVLSS